MTQSFRRTAALGLLGCALCLAVPLCVSAQDVDADRLAMNGRELSAEAAQSLETRVKSAPDDLEARTQLLGYYFLRAHTSDEARAARQQHILWLIRNRPEAAILGTPFGGLDRFLDSSGYEEGRKAWMQQVERHPQDADILGRAASYLFLSDSDTAERLLRRAEAAAPQSPDWPLQIGHLYALGLSHQPAGDRPKLAKAALDAYERALGLMDREARQSLLSDLATTALEAGDVAKARGYAEELLAAGGDASRDWNYGNMVHHGHLVLGRIALRNGDVKSAKEHLLAAGKTPGSPQLSSFGPNMTLAKELLEKGERQVVLDYFKLCESFWKRSELDEWSRDVQAGKIPAFGANLDY